MNFFLNPVLRFFFSFKEEKGKTFFQNLIITLSYYAISLTAFIAVPINIFNDYNSGNYIIVLFLIIFLLLLIISLITLWITRNVNSIKFLFISAILTFVIAMILNGGGTRGFGLLYIIAAYPILYYLLGLKSGIFLLSFILIGVFIRFKFAGFHPNSIMNDQLNIKSFILLFSTSTILGLIALLFHNFLLKYLTKVAFIDETTGLSNRMKLEESLSQIISGKTYFKKKFSVIGIKISQFAKINSHQGTDNADKIIELFSRKLVSFLPPNSIVGRYSGTVFLFYTERYNFEDVDTLGNDLLKKLQDPVLLNDSSVSLQINVVITRYPDDGQTQQKMINNIMTGIAKVSQMPGVLSFYDETNFILEQKKYKMAESLRKAIINNELNLVYHPKLNLTNKTCQGAEVLLRWNSKDYGSVSPGVFIPLAEEIGIINNITKWVATKAALEIKTLMDIQKGKYKTLIYAINLSPIDLFDTNFIDFLKTFINNPWIIPSLIEFEITEGVMMDTSPVVESSLNFIRSSGFRLAIDDFGTGYSSLSYLHKIRVNNLKIDQSFIRTITNETEKKPVVDAIISMAQALNLEITAEGVEKVEQERYLKDRNCDYVQGFLYTKPIALDEFIGFLDSM